MPVASNDDLEWANGFGFGSPTRYGNVAAQLKQFFDQTGGLWLQGKLANKPVSSFTSAQNLHGGAESTLISMNNVYSHWGSIIVPLGFTDATVPASGGNPYGAFFASGSSGSDPVDEAALAVARYQGARLARFAAKLAD